MRRIFLASVAAVALVANSGCLIPMYSADPARRAQELIFTSEDLRTFLDEWERIWFLDQPSHLKPFRTHGTQLHVNAKAEFGRLWVAVLDADHTPIPGCTRDDCQVMQADAVDHRIAWMGNASLERLKVRPIRLRFYLENARLYSYRIV